VVQTINEIREGEVFGEVGHLICIYYQSSYVNPAIWNASFIDILLLLRIGDRYLHCFSSQKDCYLCFNLRRLNARTEVSGWAEVRLAVANAITCYDYFDRNHFCSFLVNKREPLASGCLNLKV